MITTKCPKTRVIVGQRGGEVRCPKCNGRGEINRACNACNRTGRVECAHCDEAYQLPRPTDLWSYTSCSHCQGKGKFGVRIRIACPACLGVGVLLQPRSDPTATLLAR